MAIGTGWAEGSFADASFAVGAWDAAASPFSIVSFTLTPANQLVLVFSRAPVIGGLTTDFTFTADGVEVGMDVNTPSGNRVTFDLGSTIEYDQVLLLSYVQPGDGIEALDDGQDLASFTDQAVTNGSQFGAPNNLGFARGLIRINNLVR